jgi:Fic family protein
MASRTRNFRQLSESSELLFERLSLLNPSQRELFDERFMMSWIFHDFAVEGSVISVAEIKSAIDDEIISSPMLIPKYSELIAMRDGIRFVLENAHEPVPLSLEWLKKLHYILLPADKKDQVQYRKDALIHRPYFHELAAPDKISYRMRKLTDWFRTDECRRAHPLELACEVHREIIRILPWQDLSGRVARLAMNHILIAEKYWPAIVHHVERQRYYDTLQREQDELLELCVESIAHGVTSSTRLCQGIQDGARDF